MSNRITPQERGYLFEHGFVIRATWQMPDTEWEFAVYRVGESKYAIAYRKTERAAYNAGIRYLIASGKIKARPKL